MPTRVCPRPRKETLFTLEVCGEWKFIMRVPQCLVAEENGLGVASERTKSPVCMDQSIAGGIPLSRKPTNATVRAHVVEATQSANSAIEVHNSDICTLTLSGLGSV